MAGKADKTGCYKCHKNSFKRNNSILIKCITEKVQYNLETKAHSDRIIAIHNVLSAIMKKRLILFEKSIMILKKNEEICLLWVNQLN